MKKNILITGVSGSGKTTISETLRDLGMNAVDMDEEVCSMQYRDSKEPVETEFQNHDLAWVKTVEWMCDTTKLRELLNQPGTVFCCGSADNLPEVMPLFDAVVLLQTDEDTFRKRLTTRTNNDWGRTADVQEWLLEQKHHFEDKVLERGGIRIDAHQDVRKIAEEILRIAEGE